MLHLTAGERVISFNEFHMLTLSGSRVNGKIAWQPHAKGSHATLIVPKQPELFINRCVTRACSQAVVHKMSDCCVIFHLRWQGDPYKDKHCTGFMFLCSYWVLGAVLWTLASLVDWQLNSWTSPPGFQENTICSWQKLLKQVFFFKVPSIFWKEDVLKLKSECLLIFNI